jgi:hypothetical protein
MAVDHFEIVAVVLACAAGLGFAARAVGEPPLREMDTGWVARFVPPPGSEYQMTTEAFAALQQFAASEAFGEAQMRGALGLMHDPAAKRERRIARAALKEAGGRAESMLLESLRDWRYPPPPEPSHPDTPHPWDFAAERLAMMGVHELVPLLIAAERDGRIPEGRWGNCVLFIAAVGSAESVEPTLRALEDPEERIRNSARIGIGWALKDGNLGPEMRAAVFEPLLRRSMESPVGLSPEDDVQVLIRINRARAIDALLTEDVLSPSNPRLGHVLRSFTLPPNEHVLGPGEQFNRIAVPPERLWALWRQAEVDGLEPRKGSFAGPVLLALAVSDPERTRPIAERLLAEGGWLQGTSIGALMLIENLPSGSEALLLWEAKSPGVRAPLPILYVDAVEKVYLYQTLGGLGYFLESHKDWRLGPEGFRALGLPQCADALEWVVAHYFGPSGPPADMAERQRVYFMDRNKTDRETRLLRAHEETVEETAERSRLLIFQYMREHRELFSSLRPRVEPERP